MKQEKDGINYFWDTFAVVEFESGNEKYMKYSNYPVILTIFNLVEIYWVILNQVGEEKANELFEDYRLSVVEVDDDTFKEAIKFRKKIYKDKKISCADAIGYIYAIKNNLKFLTGDKEFEKLDSVEFVTK